MKNRYLILRHAETIKDPNKNSVDWDLTADALLKINEYISEGKFDNVTKIISSTEPKAIATAKPVLEYLSKLGKQIKIETFEEFVELKREKKFLTDDDFLIQKKKELELWNERINGVESGNEAIARFKLGIQKIEEKYSGENILTITHGTIMALFLADKKNDLENIFTNWKNLAFCEIFIV